MPSWKNASQIFPSFRATHERQMAADCFGSQLAWRGPVEFFVADFDRR